MFYGVNRILLQTFFVAYIVCSLPSCFISFILLQDFLLEGRPPATSLNETDITCVLTNAHNTLVWVKIGKNTSLKKFEVNI